MNYFDKVVNTINNYKFLGEQVLEDGTVLIGKAPHVAPLAWLHKIFPVLSNDEIEFIENEMGLTMPDSYRYFLTHYSNGFKIFIDEISLDGLRKKEGRKNFENIWQPYSIFTPNIDERISNATPHYFFIGGYRWDGSLLYIDNNTGKVYRCSRNSVKPLNSWESFEEMIVSETERIAQLFDERGVKKNKNAATTPPRKK